MAPNQEYEDDINQTGHVLLTLIRDSGKNGIKQKGLTDALHRQLTDEDYAQLNRLEANGFILSQKVDVVGHPDVECIYWAVGSQPS